MKFLQIAAAALMLVSVSAGTVVAQSFRLEGRLAGLSRADVSLTDASGKKVLAASMEHGCFSLVSGNLEEGLYRLQIGKKFKYSLYCHGVDGVIGGYLDPDRPVADELEITGLPLNERYWKGCRQVKEEENRHYNELMKGRNTARTEEEKSRWIVRITGRNRHLAAFVAEMVRKEPVAGLAAAWALTYPGKYYEEAAAVYGALTDKGKGSMCGRALAQVMEERMVLADGQPAPDFAVRDKDGKECGLSRFRGQVVVLDFWASWCGPCRAELKYLKGLYEEVKDRGVRFVSISLDDSEKAWLKAVGEEQIPWDCLWESRGFKASPLKDMYRFASIPYIVVVDKDGKIAGKNLRRDDLKNKLEELLNR